MPVAVLRSRRPGRVAHAAAAAAVVLSVVSMTLARSVAASAATGSTASVAFSFSDPRITESSGLATSSFDDSVYTHNDSGDAARFFRVNSRGETVAVYTLAGATNVDWEDMASGTDANGHQVLYLADIGDNDRRRSEIDVYRVPEPRGPSADVPWVRYRFVYTDGPHDAETLLVDPRTRRMYIATKSLLGDGELYAAPAVLSTTALNLLSPVRSVPALTTSGDFSPDGSRVVLLTYLSAYWAAGLQGGWHQFSVPLQQQDEAICFTREGSSVLVGSEGLHSKVYRVGVPQVGRTTTPAASPSPSPSPSPSGTRQRTRTSTIRGPLAIGVVVVALGCGIGVLVLRRSRSG